MNLLPEGAFQHWPGQVCISSSVAIGPYSTPQNDKLNSSSPYSPHA
ncbi:hypothetical protein [Spirosoma sp.]|nr:hypothetical protein [Spirosoma sp.]MCX6218611.1 hypothetical protein [Spirosoma sp.]